MDYKIVTDHDQLKIGDKVRVIPNWRSMHVFHAYALSPYTVLVYVGHNQIRGDMWNFESLHERKRYYIHHVDFYVIGE